MRSELLVHLDRVLAGDKSAFKALQEQINADLQAQLEADRVRPS